MITLIIKFKVEMLLPACRAEHQTFRKNYETQASCNTNFATCYEYVRWTTADIDTTGI